jgi:hypothetical protein
LIARSVASSRSGTTKSRSIRKPIEYFSKADMKRFVERVIWNIGSELLSLRLDVGRDNHLAPFFGLVGDELAEIGGRACEHRAA